MDDIGHFGMSENPEKFIEYLLPVLQTVREAGANVAENVSA